MLTIKQAVQKAREYFAELFSNDNVKDLALEEVKFDDERNAWLVTLGFKSHREKTITAPSTTRLGSTDIITESLREYKTFNLNPETGDLLSIDMRSV